MAVFGSGTSIDFTTGSELKLTPSVIQIIEQNIQTQIDAREGYKEITWVDGLPSVIEVWEDNSKNKKLWTKEYTFTDGLITKVKATNEDDGSVETTNIEWVDGVPTRIDRG